MAVLRGCLIGCGFVSQYHLEGWASQTRGRLSAVCDLDEAKARAACRHGVCTAYTDARQMFERERPDFVEISTRPDSHLALVRLAAEHGVHVLCQKPIAPTLAELDEMIAICERQGVRFMVHENFRWRSWYMRMKEELDAGRLGKAFRLGVHMHDQRCLVAGGLSDQPYFHDMPRLILYEIGPHAIDLARFFFGDPQRVFAVHQHVGAQKGEDVSHVTLWFPDDRVAVLDMSWASPDRDACIAWGLHPTWIEGDRGTLCTRRDGQLEWRRAGGSPEVLPVAIDPDPMVRCYAWTQEQFLECLASGRRFPTDGDDTRCTMRAVFAGYEAARLGQPVAL
jgi:predicted dehydrogenase